MTYDTYLKGKNGKHIPTPFAIHGLAYSTQVFSWAKEFVHADKKISAKEAKIQGLKFHKRFVSYCKAVSGSNYFGGSSEGCYYFDAIKSGKHDVELFETTLRWLEVYFAAIALDTGIEFA